MIIRKALVPDFASIAELHIESWKDSYSNVLSTKLMKSTVVPSLEAHWKELDYADEDVVLVAEEKHLIGFIAVWCRPVAFIDNLHVRPSFRSKRVGSALLKAASRELVLKGHAYGYLWVFSENERAIRFYKKHGGIEREHVVKDVFGTDVPNKKIEWHDLSVMLL